MEYKLIDTMSKDAFRYGYLVNKIAPFLKAHLPRIILNMILAVPLGLFDGVLICHYTADRKAIYDKLYQEGKYKVYALTEDDSLVINDEAL